MYCLKSQCLGMICYGAKDNLGFPGGPVVKNPLANVPNNWCFRTVVLEKTFESPLDCKEIKPVNPKGNQAWLFIGRTDAEAPIVWPPNSICQLIGKDPDAGKDWGQKEKRAIEDKMIGWHHRLHGHDFEQTLGYSDGQGSLECCSPWGHKESDMT